MMCGASSDLTRVGKMGGKGVEKKANKIINLSMFKTNTNRIVLTSLQYYNMQNKMNK